MRAAKREKDQAKEELKNAVQKHKNGQRDMDRVKKELKNAEQKHNDEMEKYTEKTNCTVCLESYINREPHILNPCGHVFCKECIEQDEASRGRKCPNCNTQWSKKQRAFFT